MTKIEITYTDGSSEVQRFGTDDEAIEFLRLCNVRYWADRRERRAGNGARINSFEILP
jgi:hypothetical protein